MKNILPKIALLFVIGTIIFSCSIVKRVPQNKQLLVKNEIFVNEKQITEERIHNLLYQQPNNKFIAYPLRLSLYNLAKKNPDSSYNAWLNKNPNRKKKLINLLSEKQVGRLGKSYLVTGLSNFLKKTGEPPVIIDVKRVEKSKERLSGFYYNNGFFKNNVSYTIDSIGNKKGKVTYTVSTGKPYIIDSLSTEIETPKIDSLFATIQDNSLIKKDDSYLFSNFDNERKRITKHFRNNGVYKFQESDVNFISVQNDSTQKLDIILKIEDQSVKKGDTLVKKPFTIYSISEVNIFTNSTSKMENNQEKDSLTFNNYNFYSIGNLKYKPKAILNAVFIEKGSLFSDTKRALTLKSLNNLNVFNNPNIQYKEDPKDATALIANIYLVNKPKFAWQPSIDFTTSNIQQFGIVTQMSLTWRNVFNRAENIELSGRANTGSSKDFANPNNVFFNVFEYGFDVKLNIPRILFPINTKKIIKKEMFPSTQISAGLTNQRNIGLDKQSLAGGINYNWSSTNGRNNFKFELFNIFYVRNLNPGNYFNVYRTSYDRLNKLAIQYNANPDYFENGNLTNEGTLSFIGDVLYGQTIINPGDQDYKTVLGISGRYIRLIEDNLIVSSALSFNTSTKSNIQDKSYYNFKARVESAGNFLSLLSKELNLAEEESTAKNKKLFGLEYAQYIKTEVDFVKQWDLGKKNVFAIRSFAGIAIPYGNANTIPFLRSYFAGGSNDNRGWQPYSLGPGRSGGLSDLYQANFKLTFSTEYRFRVSGNFHSAIFVDAGNIWNCLDGTEDLENNGNIFEGIKSLQDIAVGSGIGLRYDFDFFVLRIDLGYKTYNPAREMSDRWFKEINFSKTVLNLAINYPF